MNRHDTKLVNTVNIEPWLNQLYTISIPITILLEGEDFNGETIGKQQCFTVLISHAHFRIVYANFSSWVYSNLHVGLADLYLVSTMVIKGDVH